MKGWRTLGINLLIAFANFLIVYNWSDVVDAKTLALINGFGVPIVNMFLRYVTTTPLGKSE